jgi:ferric-dicitrate binding protein FerR (iron transport regulator)
MIEEETGLSQGETEEALLIGYLRGSCTEAEKVRVAQWLKEHPDNEKTLIQVAEMYYAMRTKERIQRRDSLAAFRRTLQRREGKARRIFLQRFSAAAACVALVVSIAANYYFLSRQTTEDQLITVRTNAGMRTSLTLPDGTEVHLNASGKLTYPASFGRKERRVTLDGEGYFQVARDAGRPFIVSVENKRMEVEALGTAFNIQAYASDSLLKTTLVEGSVKIGMQSASGGWQHAKLKPAERAVYNLSADRLHIAAVNPAYDTAWIQGRLIFKDTPVPEVMTRLSYFYGVTFDVEDEIINRYTFTGTFENRQLSQVLDYLCISSHINYKIIPSYEDDSQGVRRPKVILKKERRKT